MNTTDTNRTCSRRRVVILSAPSGSGKSTIIKRLMEKPDLNLSFSISCTSRLPRGEEKHGVDYYFLTPREFAIKVDKGEFVEWEEVYAGTCYGTLHSEVDRVCGNGHTLIMDVDVKGGVNIKKCFGADALAIFIMPPSVDELRRRLEQRGTDLPEAIERRLAKAEYEMSFATEFDTVVVNDDLEKAVADAERLIRSFLADATCRTDSEPVL